MVLTGTLLILPGAATVEYSNEKLWTERLLWPLFIEEENRHTPLFPLGTYMPPIMTESTTITSKQNPLLISRSVHIPRGVTVTIDPDVTIYVHEFGTIIVDGRLEIRGTRHSPILFSTNERHEDNKVWNGIFFRPGSSGKLSHTTFEYASPAVSCDAASTVAISNSTIHYGNLGIYTKSAHCDIVDSTIQGTGDGISAVHTMPSLNNVSFFVYRDDVKTHSLP